MEHASAPSMSLNEAPSPTSQLSVFSNETNALSDREALQVERFLHINIVLFGLVVSRKRPPDVVPLHYFVQYHELRYFPRERLRLIEPSAGCVLVLSQDQNPASRQIG